MYQINYKGLIGYLPEMITVKTRNAAAMYYAQIVASDSIARAISSAIVEKARFDIECRPNPESYWRAVAPKDLSAKYHVRIDKLADNAVSAQIFHEKFTPVELREDTSAENADKEHDRLFFLPDGMDIDDAIWTHITQFSTPLIPEFKDLLCAELLARSNQREKPYAFVATSHIGNSVILRINANDGEMDQLVSEMVQSGRLTF